MPENSSKWACLLLSLYMVGLRSGLGLPDEILYGRQFLAPKNKRKRNISIAGGKIKQQVQQKDEPLNAVHEFVSHRSPSPGSSFASLQSGIVGSAKMWKEQAAEQQLEERKGPFDVFTMHTSKIEWVKLLVHHISVKKMTRGCPAKPVYSQWVDSRSRRLTLWETQVFVWQAKWKFCFTVLYLFPQIASHTDSFRNSNCWIRSQLFPSLQDCLGGLLLTGNDVQTAGRKSLRSAMSGLGFRLRLLNPQGRRSGPPTDACC